MKSSQSFMRESHFSSTRGQRFLKAIFAGASAIALASSGGIAYSATLATFSFPATNSLVVSTEDANVTVSNFGLSAGTIETNITTGSYFPNEPYIEETGGWTSSTQDAAKYFKFTITADSGYTFDITNIAFNAYATSAGPSAFGFGLGDTEIYNVNAPSASLVTVSQSISTYNGLTTTEIRIHGWLNGSRTSTGLGTFRIDDVVILGNINTLSGGSLYFLGSDTTRGGTGTWLNTGGTEWSATDADGGTGVAWDSTKTAVFNGDTASTVTVSGTIDADKGLTFKTTGTTLSGGTAIDLGGATAADNTITTDSGVTATISTVLTGSTGMTKAGLGILELNGNNSYSGGTFINAGRLLLGHNAAAGTGTITMNGTGAELQLAQGLTGVTNDLVIANDGDLKTIRFDDSSDISPSTYEGNITINETASGNFEVQVGSGDTFNITGDIGGSGGAGLKKTGTGNLVLTGTNSYTGGTSVTAGTLTGNTTSLQGNMTIASGAVAAFDQAADGSYTGNVSGSGSLVKTGAGNLTLTGTHVYSGGTTVSGGTLTGSTSNLQGAITNNAALVFNQSSAGSHVGGITGAGSLTKTGAGNLTLAGTNSYSGGTTVSGGTLTGTTSSLQGDITNNAAVAITQGSTGTYSGDMDGTGTLAISGGGTVTLSGTNSYSGGTSITASTVLVGSSTGMGAGTVTLESGIIDAQAGLTIGNAMTLKQSAETQQVLGYWNFNGLSIGSASAPGSGGVPTTISADLGSGSLSLTGWTGLVDDFGGSTINSLNGDVAGASLSLVSNAGNGSYIQISGLDMTGFADLEASFATRGTATGFSSGTWSYSTDGSSFTNFGSNTATTSGTFALASSGTTAGLDGAATGYLRYTLSGATDTSGNNRIDNLQLTAISAGAMPTVGSSATSGTTTFTGNLTLDGNAQLTAAGGGTAAFSGIIADGINGAKGVTKIGAGTVVLSGTNTYDGVTAVTAGTLVVNGDQSGATGAVTVSNTGSRLMGTGTLGGNTIINTGAIHSAGAATGAVGTQVFAGDLTYSSGAIFEWDLNANLDGDGAGIDNGTAGTDFDNVNVTGTVTASSGSIFKVVFGAGVDLADAFWSTNGITQTWDMSAIFGSAISGSFTSVQSTVDPVTQGTFTINGTSLTWTAVPEPSSALAGLMLGAGLLRRRRTA